MMTGFSWRHIPAILSATSMFLGGLFHGVAKAREALLIYGMSEAISNSREAQVVYYGHTIRTSTLGLLVFAFYLQGNLAAVDTTMAIMGAHCGIVDVLLLWYYGNHNRRIKKYTHMQ